MYGYIEAEIEMAGHTTAVSSAAKKERSNMGCQRCQRLLEKIKMLETAVVDFRDCSANYDKVREAEDNLISELGWIEPIGCQCGGE